MADSGQPKRPVWHCVVRDQVCGCGRERHDPHLSRRSHVDIADFEHRNCNVCWCMVRDTVCSRGQGRFWLRSHLYFPRRSRVDIGYADQRDRYVSLDRRCLVRVAVRRRRIWRQSPHLSRRSHVDTAVRSMGRYSAGCCVVRITVCGSGVYLQNKHHSLHYYHFFRWSNLDMAAGLDGNGNPERRCLVRDAVCGCGTERDHTYAAIGLLFARRNRPRTVRSTLLP